MTKLAVGSEINYTCIALSSEEYERAICDMNTSIRGFVVEGKYQPAEDSELFLSKDWSLIILAEYSSNYWVIIQEHPSDAKRVMRDIVQQDFYEVLEYDVWKPMDSRPWDLAAVVTRVDMD